MYKELYESLVARTLDDAIGPDVTEIGAYAFYGNTGPVTAVFPNVLSIGVSAFQNDTRLTEVDMPNATTVATGMFQACSSLTTALLPKVTNWSAYMFYGCTSLELCELSSAFASSSFTNMNIGNFTNVGNNAPTKTDADGNEYKCLIKIGRSASQLVLVFNFPSGAPTTTKFECPDGYIIYDTDTSSWKAVTT
jgi:hypothetical protein